MMVKGFISRWDDNKGYGFIKTEEGDEIFVHKKEFIDRAILGVEFDVEEQNKGFRAKNVKKIKIKEIEND